MENIGKKNIEYDGPWTTIKFPIGRSGYIESLSVPFSKEEITTLSKMSELVNRIGNLSGDSGLVRELSTRLCIPNTYGLTDRQHALDLLKGSLGLVRWSLEEIEKKGYSRVSGFPKAAKEIEEMLLTFLPKERKVKKTSDQ